MTWACIDYYWRCFFHYICFEREEKDTAEGMWIKIIYMYTIGNDVVMKEKNNIYDEAERGPMAVEAPLRRTEGM